jgi:hypothetical protein
MTAKPTKVKHRHDQIFEDGFLHALVVSKSGGWTTVETKDGKHYKYRNGQLEEVPFDTPDAAPDIESVPKNLRHLIPAPPEPKQPKAKATMLRIMKEVVPKAEYVVTKEVKTKSGRVSVDNDDPIAKLLRGLDLMQVYVKVAEARGMLVPELQDRFRHLNAGMQRMNLGNMLRKAMK